MSGLFNQRNQGASERDVLLSKFSSARNDTMLIFAFTLMNILLLVTGGNMYMLFAANVPYFIVDMGMLLCGKYPEEIYVGEFADMEFLGDGAFVIFVIIAVAITCLYLLAFLFSKKQKSGWLVFALVLICIDTAFMLFIYQPSAMMIPDIAFHAFMIYGLARGINALKKLKELPPEEDPVQDVSPEVSEETKNPELVNSAPIRAADLTVKSRVLLEETVYGHKIVYRRVKKTNELVIDGFVYAEYIAWAEMAHMLTANLDGHVFSVGFDSAAAKSYLMVDGRTVKEKVRLI